MNLCVQGTERPVWGVISVICQNILVLSPFRHKVALSWFFCGWVGLHPGILSYFGQWGMSKNDVPFMDRASTLSRAPFSVSGLMISKASDSDCSSNHNLRGRQEGRQGPWLTLKRHKCEQEINFVLC